MSKSYSNKGTLFSDSQSGYNEAHSPGSLKAGHTASVICN